jgi:amino acid adenylation domain-containing protein
MTTPEKLPLTDAQEEVWLAGQLGEHADVAYNWTWLVRLRGALDAGLVRSVVRGLVKRHEALRTAIVSEGATGPSQRVYPTVPVEVPLIDLSAGGDLEALVAEAERRPFTLSRAPLVAFSLVQLGPAEHVLMINGHHVIADGYSVGVIMDDLAAGLRGAAAERPGSFTDHVRWRFGAERAAEVADAERFWAARFADGFSRLRLPADKLPSASAEPRGARARHPLPPGLLAAARELGNRHGATLFSTLLAAFGAFLHRLTGQSDLVIGVSSAGRRFPEDAHLVAHSVNLLPVRLTLTIGESFARWLGEVRDAVFDAQDHGAVPLAKLVRHLGWTNAPQSPVLPVTFNVETTRVPDFGPFDAELAVPDGPRGAPRELTVAFVVEGDDAALDVIYRADRFDDGTIRGWMSAVLGLLSAAVADADRPVDQLPLVDGPAWEPAWEPARESDETRVDYPAAGVHELFAERAARSPDAVAVVAGQERLTFRQLDERSGRLATRLRSLGIGTQSLVGVCLPRSTGLVVAFLAVLRAGGAYVPLDPAYPPDRLAHMISDSGLRVVLGRAGPAEELRDGPEVRWVDIDAPCADEATSVAVDTPDQLAYVTYTSGSTGRPKGVMVSHRGVVRLLSPMRYATVESSDTVLVSSAIPFDVLTFELWGALLHGAKAVMMPSPTPSVEELGRLLVRHGVTTAWLIAGLFHRIVDTDARLLAPLRQVLAGGEALSPRHCARVAAELPGLRLINGYGPTENTTFSTAWPVPPDFAGDRPVPIGRPIDNSTAYVLDGTLRPLPPGVPGELYLGGAGVARGYLGRPGLTAERFLPDPFGPPGARMYRSGDRARRRADGLIEFLGRVDDQVKLRGYRVEPGEVAAVLAEHPDVSQAVAVVREDTPGDPRLVGYVVPGDGHQVDAAELRRHAARRLPDYMLPAAVVPVPRLPVSAQGKLDRAALPAPDWLAGRTAAVVAPGTRTERWLAGIWEEMLGLTGLGVTDDLFAAGGHSLHAMRVISRVATGTRVEIPLRQVFETPTVRELAAFVDDAIAHGRTVRAASSILDDLDEMGIRR